MTLEFRKAPLKNLMEEPSSFTPDNFVLFNPAGDAADSGFSLEGLSASIVSKAAAGLTQLGTWNATTNLTDGAATLPSVPNFDVGSFYDVTTAGTRFGIVWAINDKIIVAQKPDGTKVWTKQAATGDLFDPANVYAASGTGADANSGTLLRPKKTLSSAISVVSQPGTIILSAGAYGTVGSTLAIAKQNILIVGRGANSSNQCTLSDNLTLNAARLRLRDVNSAGTITWTDTTGGHQLLGVGGLANFVFAAASTARGFAIIADSDLTSSSAASNIDLADLPAGQTASLYLTRVTSVRANIGAGWVVYVTDCKDFQCTSIAATGTLLSTDDLPYVAFLTTQAELDAAKSAATMPSLGYYIVDFDGATGVGNVTRGDVLYKRAPSLMSLHKKYAYAPPTIFGPDGKTYCKQAGTWIEVGSGGGSSGSVNYVRLVRTTSQSLTLGGKVIFPTEELKLGTSISSNSATGQITLTAGQSYELEGSIPVASSVTRLQYQWYNETTSQWIGFPASYYSPSDTAANASAGGTAIASISVATTTVVSLRIQQPSAGVTIGANGDHPNATGCWASIRGLTNTPAASTSTYTNPLVLSSAGIVNPTKGSTTVDYMSLVDDGSGWCTVSGALNQTTAGTAGDGTLLVNLPTSWSGSIDPTFHPYSNQTNVLSGVNEVFKIIPGSWGTVSRNDGAAQTLMVIPHGPRQVKLLGAFAISGGPAFWNYLDWDYFQLSGIIQFQFSFRFKKA